MDLNPTIQFKIKDKRIALPARGTVGAAAIDLQACITEELVLRPGQVYTVGAGIALNIGAPGIAAMILPRSGLGAKGLVLGNLTGLIDSDYQGELLMALWNRNEDKSIVIKPLDRVAQLVFVPVLLPNLVCVEDFHDKTERGAGGFGSTGV